MPVRYSQAPTAGDANFAMYYDEELRAGAALPEFARPRPARATTTWVASTVSIPTHDLDVPDVVWFGMLAHGSWRCGRTASRATCSPRTARTASPGTFYCKDQDDWYAQALHQHHLATYLGLLTGTPVDVATLPPSRNRQSKEARLIKRVGPVRTALDKLLG